MEADGGTGDKTIPMKDGAQTASDGEECDSDLEVDAETGMKSAYSVGDLMDALNNEDEVDGHVAEHHHLQTKMECVPEKGVKFDCTSASVSWPSCPENSLSTDTSCDVVEEKVSNAAELSSSASNNSESTARVLDKSNSKDRNVLAGQNHESSSVESADAAVLYESVADIRERKRRSLSQEQDQASPVRVVSDISGRFVVDDSQKVDRKDSAEPSAQSVGLSPETDEHIARNNSTPLTDIASDPASVVNVVSQKENETRLAEGHEENSTIRDGTPSVAAPDDDELDVPPQDIYENAGEVLEGGESVDPGHEIYENVEPPEGQGGGSNGRGVLSDDDGWSSSEFEDYEEVGSQGSRVSEDSANGRSKAKESAAVAAAAADKVAPPRRKKLEKVSWRKSMSANVDHQSAITAASSIFDRLTSRLSQKSKKEEEQEPEDEDCPVLEIDMDIFNQPLAELVAAPDGLTSLQLKRRHVVSTIIDSEKNYATSLRQIILDYEQPLLDSRPQILTKDAIRLIFHKIREILQCHRMFQIELAEIARLWDTDEKIGDVFTASFSKSIVFEVYSAFVNNFSLAMETAKKLARTRPTFAEFLKQKLEASTDRLSLFGLMVKPIQRFPQFIMLLQDLLKFTPKDHHDRLSLQLALTELDTLTHRLNDTKRDSDSRREARHLATNLVGRRSMKLEAEEYLVRQDDVIQIKRKNGETRTKARRLYLLSDQLVCTKVICRENGVTPEKCTLVWSVPVREIEVLQPTLPSTYKVNVGAGKSTVSSVKSDRASAVGSEYNPYRKELDNMLHDLTLLESMSQLGAQLRLRYDDLSMEMLNELTKSLQLMIRQKCDVDRCLMSLAVPARGSVKTNCTFQLAVASLKHEWLLELQNVKLAIDPRNLPAWSLSENELLTSKPPLFVQPLLLDITKEDSKRLSKQKKKLKDTIQCSTCVVLPSIDMPGAGIQHLWVCNGDKSKGQVSIVSLHTNQPCLVESFRVCDTTINCAETVPGFSATADKYAFPGDTVWMATDNETIVICNVIEEERSSKNTTVLKTECRVTSIKYLDGCVYAGLKSGALLVYARNADGVWLVKSREKVVLGSGAVSCLLVVGRELLAVCDTTLYVISASMAPSSKAGQPDKFTIDKVTHLLASDLGPIQCMVKAGVGLMVSFSKSSIIRLYHLENFSHLQDVNVASAITPLLDGKELIAPVSDDRKLQSLHITCLLSDRGLLWVGTSYGFILTLPLPRLEGVPKVKRRPTVSYHGHTGPVRFLTAVCCGAGKIGSARLGSLARSDASDKFCVTKNGVNASTDNRRTLYAVETLEGTLVASPRPSLRSQWRSTPDLSLADEDDDDVCDLYENLLRGVDDTEIDAELATLSTVSDGGGRSKNQHHRKTATTMNVVSRNVMSAVRKNIAAVQQKAGVARPRGLGPRSPPGDRCGLVVSLDESGAVSSDEGGMEDEAQHKSELQSGAGLTDSAQSTETPKVFERSQSANSSYRRINVPSCPAMVSSDLQHVYSSKAVILASGGEGHANWTDPKPFERAYEDTCLLLWQC